MGKYRTRELTQRVRYALLAGVAGAFLIPQVAAAAPTGEHDMTEHVHVGRTTTAAGTDTNITATATNNVIKWADYSVKQGETVNYDGKNYLNIVTGGNTSAINGSITGGGDIYLVNPNGVIFGKTASVNVGNLYVSTQEESTLNMTAFTGSGNSPLSTTVTDVGKADVVNMGSITANKVEVYGRSIRILDAANVHATTSPVILHTDTATNGGYAHIGYQSGAEPAATAYKVNGANAVAADNYYQLVSTPTEFQNINNDLAKNYMLANDIDFTNSTTHAAGEITPIGGNTYADFTGKLDGNFFRVKNFSVASTVSYAGLFGRTSGAKIENLGVTAATITGGTAANNFAGGIAGYTMGNTLIRNVYVKKDTTVDGRSGKLGGIVGGTEDTTFDSVYSLATIGLGGGLIGSSGSGTNIYNTYSDTSYLSTVSLPQQIYFIYVIDPDNGTYIENSYATGTLSWNEGNLTGNISKDTYKISRATGKATRIGTTAITSTPPPPVIGDMNSVATYAGWSINNTGAPGAKWRIYEGRTLPLLTAFMDGTATATYDTRYFNANGTLNTESANTAKSNKGADIETTYNSQYVKIVGKNTAGDTVVGDKSNVVTYAGAMQYNADGTPNLDHIYDYVGTTGTNDFDKTNGIRNAGTKAILWSDQDGPNLRGVNVTVKQREVKLNDGTIKPNRMYNGKSDVTDAFISELKKGSINSSGFTAEDVEAHSVNLDFTTGGFKAVMVKNGTLPATGANLDKNVGTDKPVKFTGSIGFSGEDAANYHFDNTSLSNITGTATITKAPLYLKINKTRANAKIYDGTDAVLDPAMKQTGTTTPNITLDKSKIAPAIGVTPSTIPDGAIMRNDSDVVDDVDLTNVTDPTYTDTAGNAQIHVGDHSLQYTNVGLQGADARNYDLYYTPDSGTKTAVTNSKVYLAGEIIRREIPSTGFEVYKKVTDPLTGAITQVKVDAEKVYDGTSSYTPESGTYLTSNITTTDPNKGIVARDLGHITFSLTPGKTAHFTDDNGTETTHVSNTTGVAYNVTGHTDNAAEYRLGDYYIKVKVNGSDVDTALTNTFDVTGKGKITPKLLTATVVNSNITKVYDGWTKQTDGNRTLTPGEDLITLAGFVTGETRTNTSTADYATKNVILVSGTPTKQNVTYTASFDRGTGVASEDYILDAAATGTNRYQKTLTTDSSGAQTTGIITPRPVTVKFADVTKVYDGTAINTDITANDLGDTAVDKAVLQDDGKSASAISATGITSRYGNGTAASFAENRNAGSRSVEYVGLAGVLGTNYAVDNKQYGKGTITRRRIDPSGFQVRKADGTIADASKVYDGTDLSDLPTGASLVTPTATSGDTGIVAHDEGKITFKLKDGSHGYFSSDRDGNNRTSHVSEAHYVAYDIVAHTSDDTNNPLTNYTFGSAAATTLKNLEDVNNANPAHVTADGSITAAPLHAQTHSIEKVYDGLAAHTDGNRDAVADKDTIITFTGWVTHNGITEKRTNNSSAVYQAGHSVGAKDVAYDAFGVDITTKDVTYTAALTGNYADDYKIVDITGAGAATAGVTTTVADAGKITPRALKIVMDDVSKTYDGNAKNTTVSVKEITDTIGSAVIDDILSDDNVTALDLTNQYLAKMAAAPANYKSTYGRGNTDARFVENVNASNGTPHDVQYTNMRKAFNEEFGTFSAGNYSVEKNVYGKGTINRRNIDPNNFDVVDDHNVTSHATKEYDGTTTYNVPTGWKLNPSSGPTTGVIAEDDVTFHLTSDGAQFTTAAHNPTPNAYDADKVMYNVVASGDREKIKNYTLGGRKLEDGKAKVYGEGKITRRVLSLALVNNTDINKVYDGQTGVVDTDTKHWKALTKTDAKGNVAYTTGSKELVNDGSSFHIEANYRNSANTANDKNVAYDSATPRNIIDKAIEYNIHIAGTGDARNYAFANGTSTPTNAENGLKLSSTGKITPKDLSGAFEKVTKVYDGTTNVPAADVKFKTGADGVIAGDNITFTHSEAFQSANVRGDGTTKTIDGTEQKNWINYSGLSLGGTSADNYTINATAVGLGEITPLQLTPSNVTLTTTPATKEYDGGVKVKKDGSDAISAIKNYITGATVTVGGSPVSVLTDLELQSAEYDTKNVVGGTQPRVTYHMKYKGTSGNFTLTPGAETFDGKGDGEITKKDVTATIKGPLTKVYDATADTIGAAKNATTGAAVVTADDLVTFVGLVAGDGATNATTATFDNKNVGTNKTVTYDIKLDTTSAGNYNIKYNGAAITAPITQAGNTITKRSVEIKFNDPPSRMYNTSAKNTYIKPFVSADDAAVLKTDANTLVSGTDLVGLTGIDSNYVKNDKTTPDPNVGTNKYVRFENIRTAMGTALGTDAANYEFNDTGYARGDITRRQISASKFHFKTNAFAEKEYDGGYTVKWHGDPTAIKNYFTSSSVEIDGVEEPINLADIVVDTTASKYRVKDVGAYTTLPAPDGRQYNAEVDYSISFSSQNFDITDLVNDKIPFTDHGIIKPKDVTVTLKTPFTKVYDATTDVIVKRANNQLEKATANDLVTLTGLVAGDGATNVTTARYGGVTPASDDKNAGTNKDVTYNVKIDSSHAGNYRLIDATGAAITAPITQTGNTITKRSVEIKFNDPPSRMYNTTAKNTYIKPFVSADDAAVLKTDANTLVSGTDLVGLTGIDSNYVKNDKTTPDPNVGTNKYVRFENIRTAMGTALGTDAANYEFNDTAYGKGTITKARVDALTDFDFRTSAFAEKEYDGNRDIKWQGDAGKIENYFVTAPGTQGSRVKIDGVWRDITSSDIKVDAAHSKYHNKNVGTYATDSSTGKQYNARVDYRIKISTQNFDVDHLSDGFIPFDNQPAIITPRDITPYFNKTHIIKEYDGTAALSTANINAINATKRLSILVPGDDVTLDVAGVYMDTARTQDEKNASADTEAIAKARTDANAGRSVKYNLSLDGTDKGNYGFKNTSGGYDMNTVVYGPGDIYKKTLTVGVDNIDKVYDGTRTVVRDAGGGVFPPHPEAGKFRLSGFVGSDSFSFDQTAADKIDGLYSDPDVSRAADGTFLDKDIAYSGVKAAFENYADNHAGSAAKNYRVDSDTVSGKGKITPRTITPNDIANGLTLADATKVYDGTTKVKYNGQNTSDALKNYLTSATVNINGTPIDIKKEELTIRADEASTHYDTANVAGGAQPRVTYTLNYTGHNFDITGPITKTANGTITKRQVTAYAPRQLTKEYDGTRKVYDSGDPTIKTYYRENQVKSQVKSGADIVQLEEENGDRGLLTNDGVQNISTATFADKKAGTGRTVNYNVAVDGTHAGNYEIVDQGGHVISHLTTTNNTITPRRLDISFEDVSRAYNGTSENTDVTALVKDADARATLRRDGVNPSGEQLILRDAANNDITLPSDYGYGRTDSAFTKNADANQTGEPPKDVQYRKLGDAMRTLLGNDAGNYDFDETGYGKGRITKASVRESDFRMKFKDAVKEYDGTDAVSDARSRLNPTDSRMRLPRAEGWKPFALQDKDIADIKGTYQSTGGKRSKDASENSRGVQYEVQLNDRNFDFENGWNGKIHGDGAGKINRRAIMAETLPYLTKEYDGTRGVVNAARDADGNLITRSGDGLMRFRHANDTAKRALITGDDVSNATTATYDTENVAWKDGVWNQGNGTAADVSVTYALALSGADAANYKIVDSKGTEVTNAKGLGKITPKEIVLKADPQERWINEGLPTSYTGTPMGKNLSHNEVPEIVPSDTPLPGTIDYSSPNARLRVGYYAVEGMYHAPNGAKDGDAVSRNYRFIQDPANKTALYIGPYIPDYEYYKAMTQVSKMTPDEYAYENASLDRTNHYSRKPTAQVDPVPPAINVVKDGVDIRQNDINVLDDTVYTIVDEVFG